MGGMTDPKERGAALVTGAGKRLGRAIAIELADLGHDIAIHYRSSADEARATAGEIEARGRRAAVLAGDLANEAEVLPLVEQAAEALGPVTVLVNSAAVFDHDSPGTATREGWDRQLGVNLRAPFVLTQQLLLHLPEDRAGHVINLIDQRVFNLTPNYTSYTVAKYALWGLTQHLALALAPRIRVNAIGPGPALPAPGMSDEVFQRLAEAMPLGRGTSPDEIARTARFLMEMPSITGQMIAPDGGFHLGWLHPKQQPGVE
jgi:NAD(P)-dependent dehydrogenase (short-subunit alcohol dehydrogenase family)